MKDFFLSVLAGSLFLALVGCSSKEEAGPSVDQSKELSSPVAEVTIDMGPVRERAAKDGVSEAAALQEIAFEKLQAQDVPAAVSYLMAIDGVADDLKYGIGERFQSPRQRVGVTTALRAHLAYQDGDFEEFEKLVASAVVDAPGHVESFGFLTLLAQIRESEVMKDTMADFRVPMDMEIASVDGETKTLREWMGDNKAMLVDFWASWCGPCIQLMPELKTKSEKLSAQGIYVAGFNTDESAQLNKAKKVQETHSMQGVPWLLDPKESSLQGMLFVDSIPRMVLIDPEGKVHYNGHPMDPGLEKALTEFGVSL